MPSLQTFLHSFLPIGGALLFCTPLAWFVTKRVSRPLRSLAMHMGCTYDFLNGKNRYHDAHVAQVRDLAGNTGRLQEKFRKTLGTNRALNVERDFDLRLQRMLRETLAAADVDGSLALFQGRSRKGHFVECSVCWKINGEEIAKRFTLDSCESALPLATYEALRHNNIVLSPVTRDDPRSRLPGIAPGFEDPDVVQIDALCVPLCDRMGEPLGVLNLFKTIKPGRGSFLPFEILFIEELAASVAVTLQVPARDRVWGRFSTETSGTKPGL